MNHKKNKVLSIFIIMLLICCVSNINTDAKVKISKKKATLYVGDTLKLKVTGTKKKVTWTSTKKKVVTVTSKGKVTAKKKGSANIKAYVNKKTYTCKITVKNKTQEPTKTPEPTSTTSPTPVPVIPVATIAPTPEPTPIVLPYSDGTYYVGSDIPAGEYALIPTSSEYSGYYEIAYDLNGSIVDNCNFDGNCIITLEPCQYLTLSKCHAVKLEDATINTTGEGMFKVGTNISAGTYRVYSFTDHSAYYAIYDNSGVYKKIIANDNFTGNAYITVDDGEYLQLSRCKLNFLH